MAEEAEDVNASVETQETTTPTPSVDETKAPEVTDGTSALWDDPNKEEPKPEDETEEKPSPETEAEEVPDETETEEQSPKKDANTRIRQLVSERNELKQQIESLNAQVYKPQTVDELVEEGMSETDAKVAALEQKLELRDFNDRVADTQFALHEDSSQVLTDFPMFDPDSKDFVPEIASQAAEILEANLIRDPNTNQIIGSNVSPYKIYKPIYDAYKRSAVEGQIKGQRATEQMVARAAAPSSSSPRQSSKSPLMELWDK